LDWGTSPTLATFSSSSPGAGPNASCPGTTSCIWTVNVPGLTSGTTYYFRISANNAVGTSHGVIASFKTP
jgi:hypothetical protein